MAQNLVIIESPFKAPTIKNYLGSNYKVIASKGHLRDLPKSTLGVDIENGFEARYINIRGKGDTIKELKKEAKSAAKIFFATDPDREGEAISWHLANVLGIPIEKTRRITFNELTKSAIKSAIKEPRNIDIELVNSQQARRILDRIVGYKLSPFLWKTVRSGLSAGRVQSAATRIIVDRENEIRAFIPKEYWTIDADLATANGGRLTAHFYGRNGEKTDLADRESAEAVLDLVEGRPFALTSLKKAVRTRHPAPPFTTSTLQQEASRKLGFQTQRIMRVAQELYEGINLGSANGGVQGLITYMRTDSLRVSADAVAMAKSYILEKFGDAHYPQQPRSYRAKAGAQDAHEAIRPSNVALEPELIKKHLTNDQYKLYKLIWSRFVASQMAAAEFDTVNAEFDVNGCLFRASGSTIRFGGFLAVYDDAEEDEAKRAHLPELTEGEVLTCLSLLPEQHFTEPPARYNEGSLIKFLEEKGIGRPSTYAPIVTTIIARGYVEREGKSLKPTELGEITTDIMVKHFPDIVNYAFTAQMEDKLDNIASGESDVQTVLSDFYEGFAKHLEEAEKTVTKEDIVIPEKETDIVCDKCGARMVIRQGRFGKFAACPNYPTCKNTKAIDKDGNLLEKTETAEKTGQLCELCGSEMLKRHGRYGEFLACSNYPKCKNAKPILKPVGVPCPKCGGDIVARNGKNRSFYYACDQYPTCDFRSWDKPTNEKCPDCGAILYVKKGKKLLVCNAEGCNYKKELPKTDE
ncbi:MAG: type I DNA topoisomerase [Ruminococcaceae bacterium]|nr:type I DNA topoisomerase [Oscillospiraceae bacterium]